MRNWIRALVAMLAALFVATAMSVPAAAGPNGMRCVVSSPISAAQLNEPNNATWSFEVFNAEPNRAYNVQVTWAGDPSNGGHPNAGIATDANGYGKTTLPRWWSPDGFLPGYQTEPYNPPTSFVAVPGDFAVRIGPKAYVLPDYIEVVRAGKTTCAGTVVE